MYNYKKTKFIPSLLSLVSLAIITLGQIQPIACAQKPTKIVLRYGDTKRKEITLFKKQISVTELIDIGWEAILVGMNKQINEGAIRTYLCIDEDADLSEEVLRACVFIKREFAKDKDGIKYVLPPTYVLNLEEKKMFKEFNIDQEIQISIRSVTYSDMICSRNAIPKKYHVSDDILAQQAADYSIKNLISKYADKPKHEIGENLIVKELSEQVTHAADPPQNGNALQRLLTMGNATKALILLLTFSFLYKNKDSLFSKKKKKRRKKKKKRRKKAKKKD